jgi:competence protein ComEC
MPSQKIKTDYIYVTDNPYTGLNVLNSGFDYHTLVADGSNSDNLLNLVKQLAEINSSGYKILKRNNSFLSVSN